MTERKRTRLYRKVLRDLEASAGEDYFPAVVKLGAILDASLVESTIRRKPKKPKARDIVTVYDIIKQYDAAADDPTIADAQYLLEARREELERAERKKRALLTDIGTVTAILTLGGTVTAGTVYAYNAYENHQQKEHLAYERTHTLGETPSAPSYSGWRVADASKETYTSDHVLSSIDPKQIIIMQNGENKSDTGIELQEYKRDDGSKTIQIEIALDDPYDRIFGHPIDRKGSEQYKKEDWLVSDNPSKQVLKLTDKDGAITYVKIEQSKRDPDTDSFKYIITKMTRQG